ncbi:PREDICTED: gibberellin 20 oxidase 3-like [Camelina sativa]|uniref:Gibberellin 20 oxidase 3-like n=1 Tax=Camelina sativa TaxID=90675 RepID=A0ABM0UTS7_CAMSA|nr:PREDICTED: gibberellin 20 oxidase 3-like [Camelina sativa]
MKSISNLPHIGFDAKVINQQPNNIPIEFIWPDKEQPSPDVKELHVPIIDISSFLSGQDNQILASQASRLVSEAAKMHGFFIVTNHGVHEGILSRAYKCMDMFFNLPASEKQKVKREWGEISGYSNSFVGRFHSELPWKETLSFRFSAEEKLKNGTETVKDYISRSMGDLNEEFGTAFQEYAEVMNTLSLKIMEFLGISLGIDRRYFREFYEDNDSILRLNFYPPCKQPNLTLGTGPHNDPTSLTILDQDQVGGLQVFVENQWRAIAPKPRSFVVNIGDTFMALTNGIYKSCLHRAVVNSERERKSIAFFLCPQKDKVVEPPKMLLEAFGQRVYPNFTWSMFLEFTQKQYRSDKNTLQEFSDRLKNKQVVSNSVI